MHVDWCRMRLYVYDRCRVLAGPRKPSASIAPATCCCMFDLELHAEKTWVIECGQFAERNRKRRGEGKPETWNAGFLSHEFCTLTLKFASPPASKTRAVCVKALVRICAGGDQGWSPLPRQVAAVWPCRNPLLRERRLLGVSGWLRYFCLDDTFETGRTRIAHRPGLSPLRVRRQTDQRAPNQRPSSDPFPAAGLRSGGFRL